jgi:ubiquinone/menaquinone biosynthesis C-methylase UbiE
VNTQSQWQFVGSVPENYEQYLVSSIFAPWADPLVNLADLQPSQRVLDIACGTGIVARTAARRLGSDGSVIGLDLSAPMLAIARSAAATEGVSIEWREGSAVQLPFVDEEFDVVFCQQGLQFFPDRSASLREMHRVLVRTGKLVLSVWREIEKSPGFLALAEGLARHLSRDAGMSMTSGPFSLSNAEELRKLVADAGFRDINVHPEVKILHYPSSNEFVLRYAAGSPLAAVVAGVDETARSALLTEVADRLGSHIDDHGLAFPIETNIVVALR